MVLGTVIIVTHNSSSCIRACLQALVPFQGWKVVMVDNNSTDDTIQEAGTCALEVLTLSNSHNLGFASAVNQAARVGEGDLLVLLNPDTIAAAGSLDKLADALRADTAGAAGGVLQATEGLHRSKASYHRKHAGRSLAGKPRLAEQSLECALPLPGP